MTVADLSAVPNPPAAPGPGDLGELAAQRRRARAARAGRWGRRLRSRLAGPARMLPGLAAAGCAIAGSWLLWGLGVALLVGAGLLLLVDARTPRGGA